MFFVIYGNNTTMREVAQSISNTVERIKCLKGIPLIVKVIGARGKSTLFYGEVAEIFPAVFTVATKDGETKTFSYSDVHSGNILFLRP
jgi:uncharacterized protein Veg